MNIDAFIRNWYAAFIPWMRENHLNDVAEVMSDCSSELYVNSLAAMHLRKFARESGVPNFWARCEWEKYDVSFGTAENLVKSWEGDYESENVRMTGYIEGKVTYWHYGDAKTDELFQTLATQLGERHAREERRARECPAFGLIWLISYAYGKERDDIEATDASRGQDWDASFSNAALTPVTPDGHDGGPFVLVGRRDMQGVWPLADPPMTSVSVALASFDKDAWAKLGPQSDKNGPRLQSPQ